MRPVTKTAGSSRAARSRRTRREGFTKEAPTKWHPTSLRHPDGEGEPFTFDNCWDWLADRIDAGVQVQVIVLKKPPGKRGFVMLLPGYGDQVIYVKLQLGADLVHGRSFHESNATDDEDE